ncbi:MAG: cation diffusion facilitator family transporter [Paludibacter sp.]
MLSVISNTTLVVFKLIIGIIIGSVSVISEAIHSGVDLVAAIIAYFAVKTANKPPDSKHLYGHGKYENFSGTIEAVLIFVAAGWIIFEAVKKLLHPEPMEEVGWGIIIMIISALVNIFVSNKLFKVGKETDSIALQADAWHLKTDVYTSLGVAVGLSLIYLTGIQILDPIVAILVALMIIRESYFLLKNSLKQKLFCYREFDFILICVR